MFYKTLLAPPVAFILVTLVAGLIFAFCARFRFHKPQSKQSQEAYSCGEEFSGHMIQPDYSQFFPFAFFFTMLHVVALVVATVPLEVTGTFAIAFVYIIGAVIGLSILLGK